MSDEKTILQKTFEYHGHRCWASTAGVRAGLAALRTLGVERTGTSSELHCIVEIGNNHGAQCFADGVSFATGCTPGKNNLEKAGWGKLALTLIDKQKQRSVRVTYWPTHQSRIAASAFMRKRGQGIPPTEIPDEEAWAMVNIVWEAPEEEVLRVDAVREHPYQDYGEVMGLVPCAECRELVAKAYLRVVGDRHVCIPCSGYDNG